MNIKDKREFEHEKIQQDFVEKMEILNIELERQKQRFDEMDSKKYEI